MTEPEFKARRLFPFLTVIAIAVSVGLVAIVIAAMVAVNADRGAPEPDVGISEPAVAPEGDDAAQEVTIRVAAVVGECLTVADNEWATVDCSLPHELEVLGTVVTPDDGVGSVVGWHTGDVMDTIFERLNTEFAIAEPGEKAAFDGRYVLVDCWLNPDDKTETICGASDLGDITKADPIDYRTTSGLIGS